MSYVDDPEWKADVMRRIEKDSTSKDERIRELESALAELAEWARDIAGDCADPIQRQQEDEMMERIDRVLEESE